MDRFAVDPARRLTVDPVDRLAVDLASRFAAGPASRFAVELADAFAVDPVGGLAGGDEGLHAEPVPAMMIIGQAFAPAVAGANPDAPGVTTAGLPAAETLLGAATKPRA